MMSSTGSGLEHPSVETCAELDMRGKPLQRSKGQRAPAWKHCWSWCVCVFCLCVLGGGGGGGVGSSLEGRRVSGSGGVSEGVVVAVFGLAELVEEEDDGLQAQDQDYPADEAGGVEGGVLLGGAGRDGHRRRGVGRCCCGHAAVGSG